LYKLGVNKWCFPGSIGYEEAFRFVSETGFDGFEVVVEEEDVSMDRHGLKRKWRDIAELASSYGLEIPSVATSLYWRYNWVLERDLEKAISVFKTQALVASIVGAKTVLVVPGVAVSRISYIEHYSRIANGLKRVEKIACDHGVYVGIENVWNKLFVSPLEFKRLLEMLDTKYL